jgi:polysaccharide export outer membrane protein
MISYIQRVSYFIVLVIGLFISSCGNMNRMAYLTDVKDSTEFDSLQFYDLVIEPGMQLNIQLTSLNSEVDKLVNSVNMGNGGAVSTTGVGVLGGGTLAGGFVVSDSGYLKVPKIGKIKVQGYGIGQLEDSLEVWFGLYTKYPMVNVRVLNFVVTVLGEVAKTGAITITSKNVDLLQVLGLTGDITLFGNRNSVTVIRNTPKGKVVRKIDLTQSDYISSEFFYVRPGDIIYVEPNMAKRFNSTLTSQFMPIVISTTSFMLLLYNVFRQ